MSGTLADTIPEWMALADQHELTARAVLPIPLEQIAIRWSHLIA